MRVLLVRPIAPNERFGLGPFFRIEPLGLEYVAAALEARGHEVRLLDLRFSQPIEKVMPAFKPQVVGIASAHTLDTNEALRVARWTKQHDPAVFTLIGGHAAAVYPYPFFAQGVDGVCFEDGEAVVPGIVDAIQTGRRLSEVPGLHSRVDPSGRTHEFVKGPCSGERVSLDLVPLPARHLIASIQKNYICVNKRPVYLIETARGCPFRCSFCTIWQHVDRSYRCRDIDTVCRDFASTGENVFIADDLFWHPKNRSFELARELKKRGIKKSWTLVQTRTDLVARNYELLKEWREYSKDFDIFFGFEAPTNAGLEGFTKDSDTGAIEEAVRVCKDLKYGITGNFIVDPDWDESGFERLWEFKDKLGLHRAGVTILTPLPGTSYFEEAKDRILEKDWSKFDMHHILWEPRLGRKRFFELFAETWKRTVLNAKGVKPWYAYLREVDPLQIPYFLHVLYRTQKLVDPQAYLAEAFPAHLAHAATRTAESHAVAPAA